MSTYPKVVFGEVEFSKEDIQTASVIEEFSPLSITIPACRFDLQVYTEDLDFSIVNPSGNFATLLNRQPVVVYESVDGDLVYIGQYYLDTWDNSNDRIIKLSFTDLVGLLDGETYKGGIWLTPVTVGSLLSEIFEGTGTQFEIDPDLAAQTLKGWIPICSYREALQQVAFAAGAYVLSARQSGFLKLGKLEPAVSMTRGIRSGVAQSGQSRVRQIDFRQTQWFVFTSSNAVTRGIRSGVPEAGQPRIRQKRWRASQWDGIIPLITIPASEQGISRNLGLKPQVTGVEVTFHDIVSGTGELNLFDGELSIGEHEITFSQPVHDLSVTGATIEESGANYAILSVASAGAVTLSGQVYEDTQTVYGIYAITGQGVKENVVSVTEATMVNSTYGRDLTQKLFDYYQQRYIKKMKLFSPTVQPGWEVIVDTLYGRQVKGVIEKMDIDLAGGFLADVEVVGIVD